MQRRWSKRKSVVSERDKKSQHVQQWKITTAAAVVAAAVVVAAVVATESNPKPEPELQSKNKKAGSKSRRRRSRQSTQNGERTKIHVAFSE